MNLASLERRSPLWSYRRALETYGRKLICLVAQSRPIASFDPSYGVGLLAAEVNRRLKARGMHHLGEASFLWCVALQHEESAHIYGEHVQGRGTGTLGSVSRHGTLSSAQHTARVLCAPTILSHNDLLVYAFVATEAAGLFSGSPDPAHDLDVATDPPGNFISPLAHLQRWPTSVRAAPSLSPFRGRGTEFKAGK
jgi:hypothetical protein